MDLTHAAFRSTGQVHGSGGRDRDSSCYHGNHAERTPDPVARHFGEIIQRKRWGLRWTLSDFGRYTGMHPDYLGLLERGLNVPTLNTILRIAEAFGVPAATLIEPVEEYRKKIGLYKGVNR